MAELEEVDLTDEEYVPDDVTLKITHMETNMASRTTLVHGVQRVKGSKTKTVLRQTVISW